MRRDVICLLGTPHGLSLVAQGLLRTMRMSCDIVIRQLGDIHLERYLSIRLVELLVESMLLVLAWLGRF